MKIEVRQLEGRRHYVVPTVMMTVGVWNGSSGPIYYPADALLASAPYWNGKPVVVYHPDMMSSGTAADPGVVNRQKIGVLFGVAFDGHRLTGDAWIDVQRVAEVDARVSRAVQARRVVEVSTGVYLTLRQTSGLYRDRWYDAAAVAMAPDHLAVLPDQKGACSVADGAGLVWNRVVVVGEEPLEMPSIWAGDGRRPMAAVIGQYR